MSLRLCQILSTLETIRYSLQSNNVDITNEVCKHENVTLKLILKMRDKTHNFRCCTVCAAYVEGLFEGANLICEGQYQIISRTKI